MILLVIFDNFICFGHNRSCQLQLKLLPDRLIHGLPPRYILRCFRVSCAVMMDCRHSVDNRVIQLRGDTGGKRLFYACAISTTHYATQHEVCRHHHRWHRRFDKHLHRIIVGVKMSLHTTYRFARVRISRKAVAVF